MGGICVKPSGGSPRERTSRKLSSEAYVLQSIREESFRLKNRPEVRPISVDKKPNSVRRVRDDHFEKKKEGSEVILANIPSIRTIPKAIEGEQVVAGWPSWLAEVAGEAINGWLPRRADTFEKLDKIGQGTYSCVFKARDLTNKKTVALKRVRFDNMDSESVKFMAREILVLRRLNHPNVIKLEGLITSRTSSSLYLVFEYMEHDLTGLVSLPGIRFTEPQVKCYMKQLLSGLDHCHSHGVLHRDIKGSNLLIDNNGILKIADFGLASVFDCNQSVPLTTRVVTLWYRPPELLLGATHYGVSVDLWSAGCILGELYAGKPIMPGRTEVEQLHRIFKLCGSPSEDYWKKTKLPHSTAFKPVHPYKRRILEAFREFPLPAVGLMETLLAVEPEQRGTASLALKNQFFTTKPYACDPSSLPHYPPSKEIDAKMRDEEATRQREGERLEKERKESHIKQHAILKGSKDGRPMRDSYSGPLVANNKYCEISRTSKDDEIEKKDVSCSQVRKDEVGNNNNNKVYKKGNKIQFSGPLVSSNVDQMIKDHDRHIQEAARRSRIEKMRVGEVEVEGKEMVRNVVYPSSRLSK
ncbi:probable serine/threonine-protein kinase At1g54610 [Lactuca sativa]|uniref:Protein kinase domain-containing protein n=1 Tax=Lactuca sativa TaxID=4236 RepID=A0A9R1XMU1_LACSA|nr:probable serine/threonine-protein kinase At1g54610 [Lactuca sativa]KAJ0218709.1 hypothetical protein LSAT_V11C300116640 [Lactuca sativa]